jgi:gliding motility-associated-like protein
MRFPKTPGLLSRNSLLVFFLLFTATGYTQLQVTPGGTPASIVNGLIGGGMTVSNISMNCPTTAYGTFANGNATNIGINNGILLTTGSATMAIGPNNSVSQGQCNNTSASDPQLIAIEPQATYDLCVLEFDIIPQCSQLTVRFVFGSEEYPEFVNASFNDAFGFFISGPGPAPGCTPGFYNNTNVATLPNNTTPVSIDNVNAGNNAAYYVDNTGGATIQYDGFTTVLTRTINVCPCQTYHWKFAIADAGDCIYDSGVFLEFLQCSNALTLTPSSTPASGCSGCNGSASVAVAGGTGPFTYSWSPGGYTTATVNNLCAGTYTVTVTDQLSCSPASTLAVTVGGSSPTLQSTQTQTNVTCNALCNGTASVNVTGGTGPYTYNWLPSGGTNANATGLCAGVYTVDVSDQTGCTGTWTFTITQPSALTTTSSSTPAACGNNNGSATVTPSGGAGSYTYSWAPSGGTSATASNLGTGSYTCTITDANGCTLVQTVTVPSTGGLASTISGTDVTCFGTPTGTATASPVGGNPGYTYSWSPSGGTNATANNLVAGTYTCVVTDGSGCTSVSQITITEPTQLTASSAGFNVTCNGVCDGQVVTIPAGGTPNYSFLWNTGCTTAACNSVCAGTYTVTITDGNGCTTTDVATVTQPAAITITTGMTQATCGQSDGSASANASGGTGAFTYQWINGPAGANYNNIPAGTYSVIATDANGCSDTSAVTVTNLNGVLLSSCGVTDVSCFGLSDGSVNVCASQGNPGYTYSWSPNVSATASATNVAAGNYVVTVTDAIGCIAVITVTVTEPPQLTMTASALPAIVCAGTPSQINAAPAGGSPGYTVGWMPGPLTGSSVNVTPTATTTYTAAVTDANGCTATAITTVTVSALPVSQFSADTTQGCAPLCVNFSDLSSVSLPSTVTSWSWDFGDNNNSTQQSPNHCYATPGVYSVTLLVTTNDGCSHTLSLNNYINVFGSPTAAFTASPQPTTILTPTINFTDMSTGADTWLWSFGDLNNSTSNLQNPTYTYSDPICYQVSLEVSSQNGCTDSTSEIICIDPDVSIYVPNTFTPNDDGINETFIPITTGINPDRYEFWVFDRWGNLIFYTDDLNEGWNGRVQGHDKLCQIDTYVWKVKCVDVLDKKHNLIGHVNLIR